MRNFDLSSAIWLTWLSLFLGLELPAVFKKVPWEPLSDWCWQLEGYWTGFRWVFLIGLAVLLVHIVSRWP